MHPLPAARLLHPKGLAPTLILRLSPTLANAPPPTSLLWPGPVAAHSGGELHRMQGESPEGLAASTLTRTDGRRGSTKTESIDAFLAATASIEQRSATLRRFGPNLLWST